MTLPHPIWNSSRRGQPKYFRLRRSGTRDRPGPALLGSVSSATLAPIWHEKAATARNLRQSIRAVLEWAVAMDLRPDNPCDRIGPVLGTQGKVVRHMRELPHGEVASALRTVRASNKRPVVKLAFEFLVLTATRSGEVRGAVWTEIDRNQGVWTIPAGRMKAYREHRVPLSRRALETLEEAKALGRATGSFFPE